MAMELSRMLGPRAVTIARAKRTVGIANIMSVTRMMEADVHLPRNPAAIPPRVPMTPAMATERKAISSDTPSPCKAPEKTSRPNWSVPIKCAQETPLRTVLGFCASGP